MSHHVTLNDRRECKMDKKKKEGLLKRALKSSNTILQNIAKRILDEEENSKTKPGYYSRFHHRHSRR